MKKIMLIGLILVMILLFACKPMEVTEPEPAPEPVPVETTPEPAPSEIETTPEEIEEPTPELAEPTYLSEVTCFDNYVSVIVTNIRDYAWDINKNGRVFLNGGWDKTPGCDKVTLEPGESMVCSEIDFPIIYKGEKKNVLQIVENGQSELVPFYCP